MSSWRKIAKILESDYDTTVDYDEGYFNCPECGDCVYECDWHDEDFINTNGEFQCPICRWVIE